MRFQDFIDSNQARKGACDIQLAIALVKMSENHIKALRGLKVTETSAATIMTTYYEALRQIVEAIAAKEGYKMYSHEAYTYFLKDRGEEIISSKFDRFRKIRNNINYYGKSIDAASVESAKKDIEEIIKSLKQRFLSDVS